MSTNTFGALFGALLIVVSLQDALAFSKYGRDCRDIGCLRDEECVIKEDPCTPYTGNKCGRYPTCRKISAKSCTGVICYENEYCKMVNNAPRCVDKDEEDARIHNRPYPAPSYRPAPPTPPPRTSSLGGSKPTGSLWGRLFGEDTPKYNQPPTRRPTYAGPSNGYYRTHTSVDSNGNKVWTFSN